LKTTFEVLSLARVETILGALRSEGANMAPAMREIATLGESFTRMHFRLQAGPDGKAWKPSLRARMTGGRTLIKSGMLRDSISSGSNAQYAQWGVNRTYAAIHQFGGNAGRGGKVKIPARPFLGISSAHQDEIATVLMRRLGKVMANAG